MGVLVVLGVVFAIAATVLLAIFVLPEGKRAALPKFFQILHDIFNFKDLLIEKILKILYVFSTMYCVLGGFFMLFSFVRMPDFYGYGYSFRWTGWSGLLFMVLGPIVCRLAYEGLMMFILLVKNTIEINKKLSCKETKEEAPVKVEAPAEVVAPVAQQSESVPTASEE